MSFQWVHGWSNEMFEVGRLGVRFSEGKEGNNLVSSIRMIWYMTGKSEKESIDDKVFC